MQRDLTRCLVGPHQEANDALYDGIRALIYEVQACIHGRNLAEMAYISFGSSIRWDFGHGGDVGWARVDDIGPNSVLQGSHHKSDVASIADPPPSSHG